MNTKMRFVVVAFLSLLLSAGAAHGQGSFLEEGQSGAGLSAFLDSGESHTGFGASLGYSFGARFDLGLVMGRSDFDHEVIGRNGSATSLMPYATLTLFKPSELSIFGAELTASYGFASYESDELDAQDLDLSDEGINAGGTIYMRLDTSPTLDVLPRVSIAYVRISQRLEDAAGRSESATIEDVGYLVGVDFLLNDRFAFGPEFSTIGGNNTYKIIVGLVIPSS